MWLKPIANISQATSLLPVLYLVWNRSYNYSRVFWAAALLKTVSFLTDTICYILMINHHPNTIVINVYVFLEFLILIWIYFLFFRSNRIRKTLVLCIILMACFAAYQFFVVKSFGNYRGHLNTVSAVVIVMFSLLAFYKLIEDTRDRQLTEVPFFWLNTAFMIYYMCCLVIFLFKSYIHSSQSHNTGHIIWATHNFFMICSNLLILKSFITWKRQNSPRTSLSGS